MKIAVDAMGGDFAPGTVVEGVAMALYQLPEYEYVLVGHQDKINFYLEKYGIANHPRLSVVHAESVVEMSEPSTSSVRAKKDCSITVCAKLLKNKEVDAMVTPGHTGATVAATKVLVRTLPGVDRPALAASMPASDGRYVLMDVGANTECDVVNLVQFAIIGSIYASYLYGLESPRVGLISVGGEDSKGNMLTKEAFGYLEELPINFVGNIESDEAITNRAIDVLVCDGFTGNVYLKCCEGLAKAVVHWLKKVLMKNALRIMGAMLAKNAFVEIKKVGSSEEMGGAPLLGLNGICIIGHGSSTPLAVRNAIRVAAECVEYDLNGRIVEAMKKYHCTTEELGAKIRANAK